MNNFKNILFAIILAFLILPLAQETLKIFPVKPLKGAITNLPDVSFNLMRWFDGSYQNEKEKYLNENFGLRHLFIRTNNEIAFDLYKKVYARDVIVGKQNYLFEKNYIRAFSGDDFVGDDSIKNICTALKFIQNEFKKINIDFVVVFAPGKASFFSEYIPDSSKRVNNSTNYFSYSANLKISGVNFIDFNDWFLKMKNKSPYPLYPKCGIHWSVYGVSLATDSLIHYIEGTRKVDLPDMKTTSIKVSKKLQETDNDIGDGLNLLFDISHPAMAYPQIDFVDSGKIRPRVLTIADSYYWNIFGSGWAGRVFDKPHFWYYYNQLYIPGEANFRENNDVNFGNEINQQQVIILLSTEANLSRLGWGFIADCEKYFKHETQDANKEKRIHEISEAIRKTPAWLKMVSEKAIQKNIPLDSMIYLDAEYVFEQELKKN